MPRTVVLRHQLADGSSHYDWLLEPPPPPSPDGAARNEGDPDRRCLMTFRTAVNPAEPGLAGFEAVRLPDHRMLYLTYEGEVSGGRGEVARVAAGEYERAREAGDSLELVVRFEGWARPREMSGRRQRGEIWIFSLR